MKVIFTAAALVLSVSTASATCIGSGSLQTCYDTQSGNSYTINRMGNSTYMNGMNSRTGTSWSQQSHSFGNSTIHQGRDSDGNNWQTNCFNGRCY